MKKKIKLGNKNFSFLRKETGTIFKEHGGKIRICLVYPNTYYTGMSNLGVRLVYSYLNKRMDVVCERAFLPEKKRTFNEKMRCSHDVFSIESNLCLSGFDILAFSVSFENDYPNIAHILTLAKIPVYAKNRERKGYPLVVMGGPCAFMNPEPVSEFFDVLFIGEAEVLLDEFFLLYKDADGSNENLCRELSKRDGFYVPSLYNVEYGYDNRIVKRTGLYGAKDKIKKLVHNALTNVDNQSAQVVTSETNFSDMYLFEAMRGCQWKCRFCAVSRIYGQVRVRDKDALIMDINKVQKTRKKIGLIAPSLTDYPYLRNILSNENVHFSITSLRASRKSASILHLIKDKSSISIAPETGSTRLRKVINKGITHKDIIETVKAIFMEPVRTLRLYFILGIPTETMDDVFETVDLVKEIRSFSKKTNIVLSVNTFVPKPFTPFQWLPMASVEDIKERLKVLKAGLRGENIRILHDIPKHAYMQGLFSLGDRRVSKIIEAMAAGNRQWISVCDELDIDYNFYVSRKKDFKEILGWDFLENGVNRKGLWEEMESATSL